MTECIVIVQFDLPKRTEEQAIKGGTGTAPTYRNLATKGLIRKHYLNGDAGTGGVYLWESRQAAEAWFIRSQELAAQQRALSWELRASMSLARFWHARERTAAAHGLMDGVYRRFTEGHGTADLRAAAGLLKELSP